MQREQQVRALMGRMLELSATACYTVGQLAVNGASLMDAGIAPGPAVGKALNTLLRAVMEGRLPNEKAALLAALEKEGPAVIYGIGTDLCDVGRIEKSIARPAFLQHVYTPAEQELIVAHTGKKQAETAAANFAAKKHF